MEAFEQLRKDHLQARMLLVNLGRAYQTALDRAQGLFETVRRHLEIHSQLEQRLLYPALAHLAPGEVTLARQDHVQMEQLLVQMRDRSLSDPEFSSWVWDLAETVEHHIESDESGILQIARDRLPKAVLKELEEEMASLRRTLTRLALTD